MSGVKRKFKNNTLLSKIVPHYYTSRFLKFVTIYIIIILILSMISLPLVSIIGAIDEVQVKSVEPVSKESTLSKPSTTSSSESSVPSTTSSATKEPTSPSTTTSPSKESTPTTSTSEPSSPSSSTSSPSESSSSSTPSESSTPKSSSPSESSSTVKTTASVSTTSTHEKSDMTVTEIEPILSDLTEGEEKTPTKFETIEITAVKTTYSLQQKESKTDSQKNDSQQQSETKDVQNIKTTLESDLGDIYKDQQLTITTEEKEKETTIIHKVDFTSSKDSKNVKLQVSHLKEKPVEIEQELPVSSDAKVYQYVDIKLTENDSYIGESGIEKMSFTFAVKKQWIHNNSLDKDTIKMIRYHNGSWQELNTSYVNETMDILYYEAFTPGLSVFAVVGESIVEDSDAIVDGSTPVPWWISFGVIASSSMILGVVLVKKRFIYRT